MVAAVFRGHSSVGTITRTDVDLEREHATLYNRRRACCAKCEEGDRCGHLFHQATTSSTTMSSQSWSVIAFQFTSNARELSHWKQVGRQGLVPRKQNRHGMFPLVLTTGTRPSPTPQRRRGSLHSVHHRCLKERRCSRRHLLATPPSSCSPTLSLQSAMMRLPNSPWNRSPTRKSRKA